MGEGAAQPGMAQPELSRVSELDSYFLDFDAPPVVPAPDSLILRPVSSGRSDPWVLPDSIPVRDRSRTAPVADPESSFLDGFESTLHQAYFSYQHSRPDVSRDLSTVSAHRPASSPGTLWLPSTLIVYA